MPRRRPARGSGTAGCSPGLTRFCFCRLLRNGRGFIPRFFVDSDLDWMYGFARSGD